MNQSLTELLRWLESSALAGILRSGTWQYPAAECVHLIGVGLLFGSIVALDLRLMGFSRTLAASVASRHLLPLAGTGFVLTAISGALLFMPDATALSGNTAFLLKLGLIALAGLNAAAFHLGPFRSIAQWDSGVVSPRMAALSGAASALLWMAVIILGRAIAYV